MFRTLYLPWTYTWSFCNISKDKFCETEKINEALIVTYFQRDLFYEDKLKLQKKISDAIFS